MARHADLTAGERRKRLFGDTRPFIRRYEQERDLWALWAAYDLDSFKNMQKGMTPQEFKDYVHRFVSTRSACFVIEDDCKWFREGRGPVAFLVVDNFGYRIEPYADIFRWATKRMILRGAVAFFQMVRYSKEVGICLVRSLESTANLFRRCGDYVPLRPCGMIPFGSPLGDEYLFSIRGSHARTDGARRDGGGFQRGSDRGRREGAGTERGGDVQGTPPVSERGREGGAEPAEEAGRAGIERERGAAQATAEVTNGR